MMFLKNKYNGIDKNIVKTVKYQTRKLLTKIPFIKNDILDIQQDLVINVLENMDKYDPSRSKRKTFIYVIVKNHIKDFLRKYYKKRQDPRLVESLDKLLSSEKSTSKYKQLLQADNVDLDLKQDIIKCIVSMDKDNQEICQLLLNGYKLSEVSRKLNISNTILKNKLKKIEENFDKFRIRNIEPVKTNKPSLDKNKRKKPTMKPALATYSMFRLFCDCRRAFKYRYIDELVPLDTNYNLYFGSLIHNCLELWHSSKNKEKVFSYIKKVCAKSELKKSKLEALAMMDGYINKYPLEKFKIISLEQNFNGSIVNPKTSISSRKLAIAGKIDGLVKLENKYFLLEHKTTSFLNQSYLEQIHNDFQILLYSYYVTTVLKKPISGIIYNILVKARLKRSEGESQLKFEERKTKLIAKSKTGKTKATRKIPESDSEYLSRLLEKYEQDSMFHRELILITPDKLASIKSYLWTLSKAVIHCCAKSEFYPNNSNCYRFNKPCSYYPLCYCRENDNSLVMQNFYIKKAPHTELSDLKNKYSPLSTLNPNLQNSTKEELDVTDRKNQTNSFFRQSYNPNLRASQNW